MANKKRLKVVSFIVAFICAMSLLTTSCGGLGSLRESAAGGAESVDTAKTQIYVGLGTNGLGDWIEHATKTFEEKYADVSFEEGKKGIQVYYTYDDKFANFDILPENYTNYQEKLIITGSIPYERVKNIALDITDIVKSPLNVNPVTGETEGAETDSIESKMYSQFKNYYGADGKYYAIPAQEAPLGIVYDVDLFEEYGLYFANSTTENYYEYECNNVYTDKTSAYKFVDGEWGKEDLSNGPDGQSGTYDDGMPATYEEFFALCDYMYREFAIEPIRWAGKVQAYATSFLTALAADYEGQEYLLKTSSEGKASNLIKFDESGNIVFDANSNPELYGLDIEYSNGYISTAQAGYYYALKFMDALINSEYYDKDLCFNGTKSHLTTQSEFLLSKKNNNQNTIAMLIEGSWWQGEASGTFTDMAEKYGEKWSMKNRNFGYMPLPKAVESKIGKQSTVMELDMLTFITNDVKDNVRKAYELFFKSIFSRSSLYDFVNITGQMRPYDITLTEEEYESLTGFGKSNYNIHSYTDLLFQPSYSKVYLTNPGLFTATAHFHWQSNLGSVPTELLRMGNSAEDIFKAIHNYWTKDRWDGYFKGICY